MKLRRSAGLGLVLLLMAAACVEASAPERVVDPARAARQAEPPGAVDVAAIVGSVDSPDGMLRFDLGLVGGRPVYQVTRQTPDGRQPIIDESWLGIEAESRSLSAGLTLVRVDPPTTITSAFELATGKARASTLEMTGGGASFVTDAGDRLTIEVRVADTAVAFRSIVEPAASDAIVVTRERTTFAVGVESTAWLQPHDAPSTFTPAYEALRLPQQPVANLRPAESGWTFPALFERGEQWLLIAEGAVGEGGVGWHLGPTVAAGEFALERPDPGEGNGLHPTTPDPARIWTSPWRIVITSPELGHVVSSDMVRHLAPESVTPRPDWVGAGRSSWSWWSDHESSRDPEALATFIALAGDLGWEYSLIDANWTEFEPAALDELVAQADAAGVGLWLWYNSGGDHNVVTEQPRDRMDEPAVRRAEMQRIADLGIVGIKVDFFQSDKAAGLALYEAIAADALEAGLMVNFHGSTIPRGLSRTYPNVMTSEGVRGAEHYTFFGSLAYAGFAPQQNTVLPFTRNVVGSMDYTPVILDPAVPRLTTAGHELALAVLFESGVQHFVDRPEVYLAQPPEIIDLLQTVPAGWDETVLLEGRPGEYVALARRHESTWWIAAIDGAGTARSISVDLGALGIAGDTPVLVVCDGPLADTTANSEDGPDAVAAWDIERTTAGAAVVLSLGAYGGCLARAG